MASGWRPAPFLIFVFVVGTGCATGEIPPAPAEAPALAPRVAASDDDLLGAIPAGAETIIEIDVAQLRASPWSRALLAIPDDERATRTATQGFDEVSDVDRAVLAVSEGAAGPTTLMVAQGRFDPARLAAALGTAWSRGAWRGSRLWERADRGLALLTPRTLISGDATAVRAAIDCAWALAPDVRRTGVAELERELRAPGGRSALIAAAEVTESMRKRVAAQVDLPLGLERAGGRLDLGTALDLELLGLLATPRQATETAHNLTATVRDLRARRALAIFGLTQFLSGVTVAAQDKRVRVHLTLPEEKREDLAAKIGFVLETIRSANRAR
jgi:hypothetical protein